MFLFAILETFTISTFEVSPKTLAGQWVDVGECRMELGILVGRGGLRCYYDATITLDEISRGAKHAEILNESVVVKQLSKRTVNDTKRDHVYLCQKV